MAVFDESALAVLFTDARSQNGWRSDPVTDSELRMAFDIAKWGPTSMNTQPMRVLFLRTREAKDRLKPALAPTNVDKVMAAPVVAIVAYDVEFHVHLPKTFPHNSRAQSLFIGNAELTYSTAFRNGTLQAAYFMLAMRAVGLDVGPISGFDLTKVNAEFFDKLSWRANMLCGIGHGDPKKIFSRLPRLEFDDVCKIA